MTLPALADYETAILALLDDASNARFTDLQVDEALRWAVIQYVEAKPAAAYAIKDLDGAATTTLLAVDTVNVQVGAAGYAMLMRSISRSESINMQPELAAQLKTTAEIYLAEFKKMLDLYSNDYNEKLALETAQQANRIALKAAGETARYAADIALQAAGDADNIATAAALVAAQTARDSALDTDNIAMQTAKAAANIALKAAGETAKYAADIALKAAGETAKYAAETARDSALDLDNIAMQTQKAAADIALKAAGETAKYAADIALQAAKADNAISKSMSDHFKLSFVLGLVNLGRRKFPRSNPDNRNWHDKWEGQF